MRQSPLLRRVETRLCAPGECGLPIEVRARNVFGEKNHFRERLFSPLHAAVSEKLAEYAATSGEPLSVLDAGCGEGSHLARIREEVKARQPVAFVGAGVDLSKAGIALAAKAHPELIWCVGDLANAPFADNRFAAILNVLSPSNTREFARMLKKTGSSSRSCRASDICGSCASVFMCSRATGRIPMQRRSSASPPAFR